MSKTKNDTKNKNKKVEKKVKPKKKQLDVKEVDGKDNCIEFEGKEYVINCRYPVEGEPNKIFYFRKYVNKEGDTRYYKYYRVCNPKGTRYRLGRPKTRRRLINDLIVKCSKEQLDIIYALLQNIKLVE